MTTSNNLHVIFGSGALGLATMRALVKRGQTVRLVNGSSKPELPSGVELLSGDAYQPDFTRQVCQGAAVVYQCAQPQYHEWAEKFPSLQSSILEGAAHAGAKLVVGDNLYMYGDTNGQPIREDLPYNAHTRKGKVRAQMAEAVLEAHRAGKVRAAIARASDYYGPNGLNSTLGERAIIPAIKGKTASLVGDLDLPHTFSFIDDFGEGMAILGEREEAVGTAWHIPSPPPLTQRQLMILFFEEIGSPPKMSSMGRTMMRLGGLFIPEARESVEMMYEFEKPFIMDDSKFKRAFGDIATTHEEAIQRTIAWYRDFLSR